MSRKKLFRKYTNMKQIQEIEKQAEALPCEVVNNLVYLAVYETSQDNEKWVEFETSDGRCFSGPIPELKGGE